MGRPAGSKNKSTLELEETAKRLGLNPFEILCKFALGDYEGLKLKASDITPAMRLHAVEEAVAYLHAKQRSVAISNADEQGFQVVIQDYTKK